MTDVSEGKKIAVREKKIINLGYNKFFYTVEALLDKTTVIFYVLEKEVISWHSPFHLFGLKLISWLTAHKLA